MIRWRSCHCRDRQNMRVKCSHLSWSVSIRGSTSSASCNLRESVTREQHSLKAAPKYFWSVCDRGALGALFHTGRKPEKKHQYSGPCLRRWSGLSQFNEDKTAWSTSVRCERCSTFAEMKGGWDWGLRELFRVFKVTDFAKERKTMMHLTAKVSWDWKGKNEWFWLFYLWLVAAGMDEKTERSGRVKDWKTKRVEGSGGTSLLHVGGQNCLTGHNW